VPGGIGVLDAGMVGALVLYGVAPAQAAAGVLMYHAIAFWVPGVGGLYAYLRLRSRLLVPVRQGVAGVLSTDSSTPVLDRAHGERGRRLSANE
jgi:hypothetical protein